MSSSEAGFGHAPAEHGTDSAISQELAAVEQERKQLQDQLDATTSKLADAVEMQTRQAATIEALGAEALEADRHLMLLNAASLNAAAGKLLHQAAQYNYRLVTTERAAERIAVDH